jgi:O-antigen/teichoic acid export membrane protein
MAQLKLSGVGLYALSVILVSGSNFITTPLLIKAMAPEEFSRWALMEPFLLALIPLAGLGINVGLLQKLSTQPQPAACMLSELLPYYFACASLLALGGFGIFAAVSDASPTLAALCGLIVFGEGGLLLFMAYW